MRPVFGPFSSGATTPPTAGPCVCTSVGCAGGGAGGGGGAGACACTWTSPEDCCAHAGGAPTIPASASPPPAAIHLRHPLIVRVLLEGHHLGLIWTRESTVHSAPGAKPRPVRTSRRCRRCAHCNGVTPIPRVPLSKGCARRQTFWRTSTMAGTCVPPERNRGRRHLLSSQAIAIECPRRRQIRMPDWRRGGPYVCIQKFFGAPLPSAKIEHAFSGLPAASSRVPDDRGR